MNDNSTYSKGRALKQTYRAVHQTKRDNSLTLLS